MRLVAPVLCIVLGACSSPPPPPSFGSDWKQVNTFTTEVQTLPFHVEHMYVVRPLDRTLKGLMQRWAKESGMTLDYRASADFTLSVQTANVRSPVLPDALSCLNGVYQPHGASMALVVNAIVVTDVPPSIEKAPETRAICTVTSATAPVPTTTVAQTEGLENTSSPVSSLPVSAASPTSEATAAAPAASLNASPPLPAHLAASAQEPPATAAASMPADIPPALP
ncbi:MAG: hypothetical protein Q4G70_09725 [Pseudomonadota bacterium]|nr:hypothetical protein [Pseudomonadota bacterium]